MQMASDYRITHRLFWKDPGSQSLHRGCGLAMLGLLLLTMIASLSSASECDNCPTPDVILYDFGVNIHQPDNIPGYSKWLGHFSAANFAGAEISKDRMCLLFSDGAVRSARESGEGLKVGADVAYTAPKGKIENGMIDYVFTGAVNQMGSGYQVNMALETACSRQTAISASASYSDPLDAKDVGAQLARDNFRPLFSKIREFEHRLRESDTRVAIDTTDGNFDMEPKKRNARPSETVPVTLTLNDCDGEPLRNRIISLVPKSSEWGPSSHNGKFAATTATTDDSGKVIVGFTLGGAPGPATARAYFSYLRPSGCEMVDFSEAVINVDGARQYQGKATFTSPVAETSGVAEVTWTLVEKAKVENTDEDDDEDVGVDEDIVNDEDEELSDEDIDNEEWWYEASGTIRGTIKVPDCDPKHVELPIKSGSDGELAINFEEKTYRFEFSADTDVTLMCGKPRRPWVISGASVFHYEGGLCPPGMSGLTAGSSMEDIMAAVSEVKTGVPYTDLKTFTGEETCNTGMYGTTKWKFKAVM